MLTAIRPHAYHDHCMPVQDNVIHTALVLSGQWLWYARGQWSICTSSNIAVNWSYCQNSLCRGGRARKGFTGGQEGSEASSFCKVHTYSTKTAIAGFDIVFSLEIRVWILHYVRELEQVFQCVLYYSRISLIRTKIIVQISGASSFQGEDNIYAKLGFGQVPLFRGVL